MKLSYDEFKDVLKPGNNIIFKSGDIITIPYDGIDKEFVVLGININPNIGEKVDYDFIDIMSTELLIPVGTEWKKKISNIDTDISDSNYNFLNFIKSDIIKELHSKLELFPQEIQNVVISKKERFLTGVNTITNKTSYTTKNIGKVWLPSIKEITDKCYMTDSDPLALQYPYFENIKNRQLNDRWWTCSSGVFRGYDAYCVCHGGDYSYVCAISTSCGAPLCLRIRIN